MNRKFKENGQGSGGGGGGGDSTPICRCRVLYLGSSVPTVTKDGLQGIQEPLRVLYPESGGMGARGIDSWLSVWSNGILLENMDENNKKITRFFPIESLHYCAAVRYVTVPQKNKMTSRFLPLISPFARAPNPSHPPLFAAIMRRTTGIKVLECHVFICKREVAANALVRCCFHAYSDSLYASKQLQAAATSTTGSIRGNSSTATSNTLIHDADSLATKWPQHHHHHHQQQQQQQPMSRASSTATLDTLNENHKVWMTSSSDDNLQHSPSDSVYDSFSLGGGGGNNRTTTVTASVTNHELQTLPRPRQITSPIAIPTPPPQPHLMSPSSSPPAPPIDSLLTVSPAAATLHKQKKHKSYFNSLGHYQQQRMHSAPSLMHAGGLSAGVPAAPPAHHLLVAPKFFKNNTFAYRKNHGRVLVPRPIAPPFVPLLMPPTHYPSAAASAQSGTDAILFNQYATTMDLMARKYRKVAMNAGNVAVPPSQQHMHHQQMLQMAAMAAQNGVAASSTSSNGFGRMEQQQAAMLRAAASRCNLAGVDNDRDNGIAGNGCHADDDDYDDNDADVNGDNDMDCHNGYDDDDSDDDRRRHHRRRGRRPPTTGTQDELAATATGVPLGPQQSPFNTGIYRRKGHLNERAFSYSIRQEHRSRSYGSLANLKFATAADLNPNDYDSKKEQEIIQMVHDLDLHGDGPLERSEVPRGMYDTSRRQSQMILVNGAANGNQATSIVNGRH